MSEALNMGQPQGTDNAVDVPVVDTAPPVEAPTEQAVSQAPQTAVPPKYAGKTAEDLARMLEDQERHIGRQANELGELRQRAQSYEQWLSQVQLQQAQQAQTAQHQQTAPEEPTKFDWENPERAVERVAERTLRVEMDGLRRQMMMENAAQQAPIAKNMAKTLYPEAFKGIADEELDRAMYGGAAAGNVMPQNLTKPEAWRMLAWILQGEKSGYKTPQAGVTPVSHTATETPMGAKPQNYGDDTIALDDQARSILKGMGMDEGEYLKNRREELKRR